MADALEIEKLPDFMQDMEIDIEETVYINGIPEKEYYSMTVDVTNDPGKNDEEEKEEAFEFLSEKEAGEFVTVGAGLVPKDEKENKAEKKKEAERPKPRQDLVDKALVIDIDAGERTQYETFGWLGRLKSSLVSKGAKVDIKEKDEGRDKEKEEKDKAEEEKAKAPGEQAKEEQPKEEQQNGPQVNAAEEQQANAAEEKKPEEKKREVPAMLLDFDPADADLTDDDLDFSIFRDDEPYTFAVLDGPDTKAAASKDPQFPKDVERPVIEIHVSVSNTQQLTDFVSMYEVKQKGLYSGKRKTNYVPVFGYSYIVLRYSMLDTASNKYMRYHLSLGFAMKDSIAQIVEKGLLPKENYKGGLQSTEQLPSDMSKAYRTNYKTLDDILEKAKIYEKAPYKLVDRNANSFVRYIVGEAGLSADELLPDANQANPFDTKDFIFENMGTVVGREYKLNEKLKEKKKEKQEQGLELEELEHEDAMQEAGFGDIHLSMMKGFGTVDKNHSLPIDMLRKISGAEQPVDLDDEEPQLIFEGLDDLSVNDSHAGEVRGNLDFKVFDIKEEPEKKGKKEKEQAKLEDEVYDLDEIEIMSEGSEENKVIGKESKKENKNAKGKGFFFEEKNTIIKENDEDEDEKEDEKENIIDFENVDEEMDDLVIEGLDFGDNEKKKGPIKINDLLKQEEKAKEQEEQPKEQKITVVNINPEDNDDEDFKIEVGEEEQPKEQKVIVVNIKPEDNNDEDFKIENVEQEVRQDQKEEEEDQKEEVEDEKEIEDEKKGADEEEENDDLIIEGLDFGNDDKNKGPKKLNDLLNLEKLNKEIKEESQKKGKRKKA